MSTLSLTITVLIIVAVGAVIWALFNPILESIWRIVWVMRLGLARRDLRAKASAVEPQVRSLVERLAKDHRLYLKKFLRIEEEQTGSELIGYVFLAGPDDYPRPEKRFISGFDTGEAPPPIRGGYRPRSDIRVNIVVRPASWSPLQAEPPGYSWPSTKPLVFDVVSAYPTSVGLKSTTTFDPAEIGPLVERVFAENGV